MKGMRYIRIRLECIAICPWSAESPPASVIRSTTSTHRLSRQFEGIFSTGLKGPCFGRFARNINARDQNSIALTRLVPTAWIARAEELIQLCCPIERIPPHSWTPIPGGRSQPGDAIGISHIIRPPYRDGEGKSRTPIEHSVWVVDGVRVIG